MQEIANGPEYWSLDRSDLHAAIDELLAEVERYRSFCGEALCGDIERDRDTLLARTEQAEPSYADKVNAPLSPETIAALNAELASGNYARYRKPQKAAEPEPEVIEVTREEFEEGARLSLERLGLTYEELEAMARDRGGNFTSTAAHTLWVAIGGGYGSPR